MKLSNKQASLSRLYDEARFSSLCAEGRWISKTTYQEGTTYIVTLTHVKSGDVISRTAPNQVWTSKIKHTFLFTPGPSKG